MRSVCRKQSLLLEIEGVPATSSCVKQRRSVRGTSLWEAAVPTSMRRELPFEVVFARHSFSAAATLRRPLSPFPAIALLPVI